MKYIVVGSSGFQWGKESSNRVLQNVNNLLNIVQGEVALDRTLGMNPEFFDKPATIQASLLFTEIDGLIQLKEPRAVLKNVEILTGSSVADMTIRVVIGYA